MKLSAEEITAGWESVGRHNVSPLSDYRMYSPLSESVDSFVRWAQSPQERINLGIKRIDKEMRGIAPGEIAMVLGFAHGGKTLLLLHTLRNNKDKHVALFIPDEPKELVLIKLTCITHNIDARILEQRVAEMTKKPSGFFVKQQQRITRTWQFLTKPYQPATWNMVLWKCVMCGVRHQNLLL